MEDLKTLREKILSYDVVIKEYEDLKAEYDKIKETISDNSINRTTEKEEE